MVKKANLTLPVVIFLVLNILVFATAFFFVSNVGGGSLVYEQKYAKEIALMIDKAEPNMTINIPFFKGIEIAEKNKFLNEDYSGLVNVDNDENLVVVQLSSGGGYEMKFFTDNLVDVEVSKGNIKLLVREDEE